MLLIHSKRKSKSWILYHSIFWTSPPLFTLLSSLLTPKGEQVTRGHMPLNGFTDGQIIGDARFRLAAALRQVSHCKILYSVMTAQIHHLHAVMHWTLLYYTILYCTILYYTTLSFTILYYTILYYTILYFTILYYTILCYTILYYAILYYTIRYHTMLYYNVLYCTILYCTM